jgi:putative ABC transport system permease protein
MWRDLLLALRWLKRNPSLTLAVMAILGLGIGASTAVFSIVDPVLLRPLPYQAAARLVGVTESTPQRMSDSIPAADFRYWRDRVSAFDQVVPFRKDMVAITNVDTPDQVWAVRTAGRLFALIGASARLGRTLIDADDDGASAPVVLSDRLWRRLFHGDPAVVGRAITISGETYTIAGILAPDFEFYSSAIDLWLPLRMTPASDYAVSVIARVKNGVSLAQTQADLNIAARELRERDPKNGAGLRIRAAAWSEDPGAYYKRSLECLLGAVGLLLLIACANTGSLLLSRTVHRQKEIAIRASIGAPLRRVVRQLLAESLALAALAAAVGIGAAYVTLKLLTRQLATLPVNIPHISRVAINGRVLVFDCVLCVLLACLCSIAPVLLASRTDFQAALRNAHSGGSRRSARIFSALVASEAALAFLLLAGSGLLIRSVSDLRHADNGFRPDHVLTLRVPIGTLTAPRPTGKYDSRSRQAEFYGRVLARLERLPQISAAAVVNNPPLSHVNTSLSTVFRSPEGTPMAVTTRTISPQYFAAMGTPLLHGRLFSNADTVDSAPVAIINEYMARHLFPDRDAVGQFLPSEQGPPKLGAKVVGVVKDAWQMDYTAPITGELYLPVRQLIFGTFMSTFVIRTTADPVSLAPAIRREVWSIDPNEPVTKVETLRDLIDDAIWIPRFSAWIFSVMALMALALTAAGIYAVVAYTSALRARELGIRVAVGAAPSDIVTDVLQRIMIPLVSGLLVSAGAALLVSKLMASLLYGINPDDPLTYAASFLLLAGMGALASVRPAWKAAKADPLVALRTE